MSFDKEGEDQAHEKRVTFKVEVDKEWISPEEDADHNQRHL